MEALWRNRLHVVTGKGGTGKTTVAAALALALAGPGRRTLLMEVEGRQGIARLLGLDPLPYEERKVATGWSPDPATPGGEVFALAVDAEAALLDYLDLFYKLGRAGRALRKLGAIDFATTIAPGVRDVLLTGKVKEAVTRTVDGKRTYDAVVVDAPPTGRIGRFLNVTAETARLAKVGPIRSQSEGVSAVLRSPTTSVHVVTLLEEMPVQETSDAVAELRRLNLPVGAVIVNGAQPDDLVPAGIAEAELKRGLAAAGLPTDPETVDGLLREGQAYADRRAAEAALREELAGLGRPLVELPRLPGLLDAAALNVLAGTLRGSG